MAYGLPFYDTIGATQTTDYGDKREANTNGDAEEAVDLYWACKPPLPSLELLKNMANKVTIRNEKYFKPFDNTDNPCCWQVDHISDDVDTILDASGIDYEVIPGDWGISYSWRNRDGIVHSMTITCVDTDTTEFVIEYWAIRRRWLGFKKDILEITPDFDFLIPELHKLNQ